MNKKLTILPMLVALMGCSTVSSTDDIPVERRDALVQMASDWGFDVSKLEYPK